jgi:DNA-binding transcriptional ArsR family regulator
MSAVGRKPAVAERRAQAPVFAALGDESRLRLLARLSGGQRCSIAELTEGSTMTRQAVTKHLRVLERVGIVYATRCGRERQFAFDPQPIGEIQEYLAQVSRHWDQALARLKAFVEEEA